MIILKVSYLILNGALEKILNLFFKTLIKVQIKLFYDLDRFYDPFKMTIIIVCFMLSNPYYEYKKVLNLNNPFKLIAAYIIP